MCVSRNHSGRVFIGHKNAGTNHQQALTTHKITRIILSHTHTEITARHNDIFKFVKLEFFHFHATTLFLHVRFAFKLHSVKA